jgi:putative intracellular protease/amidase
LIDYPDAKGLQKIATQIWTQGGMVCTVCHGPAIFPGVIDPDTGKSVLHGKTFTGFGTEGEEVMGLSAILKTWGKPWVEDIAKDLGATCMFDFHFISIILCFSSASS